MSATRTLMNTDTGSPGSRRKGDVGLVRGGRPPGFMMIQLLATLTMAGFSSSTTSPPRTSA